MLFDKIFSFATLLAAMLVSAIIIQVLRAAIYSNSLLRYLKSSNVKLKFQIKIHISSKMYYLSDYTKLIK